MSQLPSAALLGIGILLISGCADRSQPERAASVSSQSYVCLLSDARLSAGSAQRITLRADERSTGFLLLVGGKSEWHPLAVVAGSDGRVYADAAYAWRPDGGAGVLTDIQAVQTYHCVRKKAARWSVK